MKKALLLAAVVLLASCNKEQGHKLVTLALSGMTIETEQMKSTTTEAGMTDLWVYDNGTLSRHLTPSDADFAAPQMVLDYGQHTLSIVASKGENPTATATAITWTKAKDTYAQSVTLDVAANTASTQSVTLGRRVACVRVVSTDAIPATAHHATLTLTLSDQLTLATLQGTQPQTATRTITIPTTLVGQTGTFEAYTLCPSAAAWTTTLEVNVYASDNSVISHFVVPNVPLQQNHRTVLTGEVYGRTSGMTITLDDAWEEDGMTF